jgi:hypothetical protein
MHEGEADGLLFALGVCGRSPEWCDNQGTDTMNIVRESSAPFTARVIITICCARSRGVVSSTVATVQTGASDVANWRFQHFFGAPAQSSTCCKCHGGTCR